MLDLFGFCNEKNKNFSKSDIYVDYYTTIACVLQAFCEKIAEKAYIF